jgi:TIR domain
VAFEYGCFISYAHDEGHLIRRFIDDLTEALRSELGAYLNDENKLFLDQKRLSGGLSHPEVLAEAMCRSACWILVYIPKYRRMEWCRREYRAMRELESRRKEQPGPKLARGHAMIVPMLLRGHIDDLPIGVPAAEFVEDFTRFDVGQRRIVEHREFKPRIRLVAERIWDIWRAYEHVDHDGAGCEAFQLPAPDDADWGPEKGGPSQERPL